MHHPDPYADPDPDPDPEDNRPKVDAPLPDMALEPHPGFDDPISRKGVSAARRIDVAWRHSIQSSRHSQQLLGTRAWSEHGLLRMGRWPVLHTAPLAQHGTAWTGPHDSPSTRAIGLCPQYTLQAGRQAGRQAAHGIVASIHARPLCPGRGARHTQSNAAAAMLMRRHTLRHMAANVRSGRLPAIRPEKPQGGCQAAMLFPHRA